VTYFDPTDLDRMDKKEVEGNTHRLGFPVHRRQQAGALLVVIVGAAVVLGGYGDHDEVRYDRARRARVHDLRRRLVPIAMRRSSWS
jgi:hypothetical protein